MWKTQIVTKLKLWEKNQKNQMWQKSNCDKTQELKLWQNSKNQIVTKLKKHELGQNLNYEKSQMKTRN